MTFPLADEDELTELVDADFPRVDLVGKGANGIPRFLIAKQDADARGLVPPDLVRELIDKGTGPGPRPEPGSDERVTMSGSPAAITKFIHQAAQAAVAKRRETPDGDHEAVVKAKYTADDLERMASNGAAMKNPDGDVSYPIADSADVTNAVRAVGRGGADHDAIRRHIIRRAKTVGASSKIPDNWNADGSLKDPVSKDMGDAGDMGPELDDGIDGLDPTVPLATPDDDYPGDPTDPGSPAWEAIDAASAQKWTSILARARVAIDLLSEREMLEAASADPDDADNAFDLQDACAAIDFIISILAPFAVSEQSEADNGTADMDAIGKALAQAETLPEALTVIEGLSAVRKAGRVLSSANEDAIRGAVASLQKVLASLPAAPEPSDEAGAPVAKEDKTVTAPADAPVEPLGPAQMGTPKGDPPPAADAGKDEPPVEEPVAKADGGKTAMQVIYDQKGRLIGIIDPADITPVANADAEPDDGDGTDGDGSDETDAAGSGDGDLTPQPPADAGTPAGAVPDDDVTKTTPPAHDQITLSADVLKSIVAEAVNAALDALGPAKDVAKQADVAGVSEQVEALKTRLAVVEQQPAAPKVFTNGAVPPAHMMRGQDVGAVTPIDVAKAEGLKRTLYGGADAGEQRQAFDELRAAASEALRQLHSQPQ